MVHDKRTMKAALALLWALVLVAAGVWLGTVLANRARGDEITITIGAETWCGQVERVMEAPPPPPAAHRMRAIYWQTGEESVEHWRELRAPWTTTNVIVQNQWPGSMTSGAKVLSWAAGAAEAGLGFQPYFPASLTPSALAGIDWPENVTTAMSASEGEWWDPANLTAMRAMIPSRIQCAFPERSSLERRQLWMRVAPRPGETAENWAYSSPLLLAYDILVSRAEGVGSLAAGPQIYNRVSAKPETDQNLMLSVALVSQASLRQADVCFWGAKWIDDAANAHVGAVLETAIAEANALPILAEAQAARGRIGVYCGKGFGLAGLERIAFAEALLRSNLPFEFYIDIRRTADYAAVIIPALCERHWTAAEIVAYETAAQKTIDDATAAIARAGDPTGSLQATIDSKRAQWERIKAEGWIFPRSFDDETAAWLASLDTPIWTAHGKTLAYGGHSSDLKWLPSPSRIPRWPNVVLLPSASATGHSPTWSYGLGSTFNSNLARAVQGLWDEAAKVGIEPALADTNVIRTVFEQGGQAWAWDVDLATGQSSILKLEAMP